MRIDYCGLLIIVLATAHEARAQAAATDTAPTVTFGGFIDSYYAFDFDHPRDFDRAYATQPARHSEVNVNLAFVDATVSAPRYRGRLALQVGTSVQANSAGEPRVGNVSGPSLSQFIQEATAGYRLAPTLWIDAGIFPAHTGYESFISRDDMTYTRSLMAEYSPYYEAGVKATWNPAHNITAQILALNGWQNISKYNSSMAGGARIDYSPSARVVLSYDNFVGNMAPDSAPSRLRLFNDFIVQYRPSRVWQLAVSYDIGTQTRGTSRGGVASWYGAAGFIQYSVTRRAAIVGRIERYADPSQVIVATGSADPFVTNGMSIGLNVTPDPRLMWRTELRGLHSTAPVWPAKGGVDEKRGDVFAVTSLALTL